MCFFFLYYILSFTLSNIEKQMYHIYYYVQLSHQCLIYNLFQKMVFTGTFDGASWNNRVGVHSVLLATIKIPRIHSASYLNTKIMTTTYRHHEEGTTPNYVRSITFHLFLRIFIFWGGLFILESPLT